MKTRWSAVASLAAAAMWFVACADPRAAATPAPDAQRPTAVAAVSTPTGTATALASAASPTPARSRTAPTSGALLEAARAGRLDEVRRLIEARATVDERDAEQRTPLFHAAQQGHLEVARALLAAGAEVSARDRASDTPYYVAALARHAELAGLLLDAGADRMGTLAYGGTPLIAIAERGWVDVAREILKRPNIPVNHVNNLGWTALIEAIILGRGGADHQEMVRLLLAAGADPNIADRTGQRPLALARDRGYREIAQLLEAAGAR